MSTIIKDISIVVSGPSTCSALKVAIFIASKAAPKVIPIAAPKVIWKIRFSVVVLNLSSIVAPKIALKPALKSKSIRALKPRIVAKSKPAGITKYKDKTTKLYISCIYSVKALVIRGGRGTKSKNKLFKIIIFILDRESLSSNNTNIKNNNKDKLMVI